MILEIALDVGFAVCGIALVIFGVRWFIQTLRNHGPKKAKKAKGGK
jgi:TRAP-type C4-dicarboxylate transport system permease small subunit